MVVGELVGVALSAQAASPRSQHRWVLGTVSVVTLVAPAATEPRNRIVFVNERSGLVGVACYALALEGDLSDLTGLRWVDRMAIAAGELALGNRVMIVQPELGKLGRVTLAAKCDFVGL